ncbi:MAG: hypothetical protein KH745_03810, partial [Bilophila sp.]|nr:hypothetical protein [Bilophila sp.]
MFFSLKFQRNNQQNALALDSAKGKTGKRLYFHYAVEITATYHDRALFFNRNSRQEGFDKRKVLGRRGVGFGEGRGNLSPERFP